MKKLLILLAILLVSTLVVIGCGTSTPATPTPTTPIPTTPTPTTPTPTTPTPTTPTPTTPAPKPEADKHGGILRLASAGGPSGPFGIPWENALSPITTQQLCLEALLKEQVDGSMTAGLASSYDINADPNNASITFHLQKGVKFTDGTDFNAQAVKWNLEQRLASPLGVTTAQYWKSIDALDDYTVRLNLTTWRNYILRGFGDSVGFMISPTAFEKNGEEWARFHMVSTGPFMQKDFQRDVSMTLEKNPNYWQSGKPYLDGVQQTFVVDNQTRQAVFKSGEADMMDCNNSNQLAKELRDSGYTVLTQPHSGFFSLVPDSANAESPWSNRAVREAASYAIDREALVTAFGLGFEKVAYQYYPESSPAYDSTIVPRKYDVEKAKFLMGQAGYPNGFETTMTVAPNANRDIAQAMQAQLAAIGIKVNLEFPQMGAWIAGVTGTWTNGVQFMTQSLWANPNANWNLFAGEPPNWFKSLKHPDGWKDMLEASYATKEPDPAMLQKLERALYDDVTFIPLMYHEGTYAVQDSVNDTGYGTRGMWTWWNPEDTWLSK